MPVKARAKCLSYIQLLEQRGFDLPSSHIKKIRKDLWELRPEYGGTEYRFLYFAMIGRKIVIVHAITKTTQKLRDADIEKAEARIEEVRRRFEKQQQ